MSGLHFAHPNYFFLLGLAVPIAATLWYVGFRLRQKSRERYGEGELVNRYTKKPQLLWELVALGAWLCALALLVVAAAGPLKSDTPQKARTGSLQIVVVMDVSWSMAAEDYRNSIPTKDGAPGTAVIGPWGSRLDMSKYVVEHRIMPAVQGNQVGVVTYMGNGFSQADLTDDFLALRFVFDHWIKVGSAPGGGSDMAEGLSEALATFKRDEDTSKEKVIVLFSDGGFTGSQDSLAKVSHELVQQHVRLVIVGLGTSQAVPIPVYQGNQLAGYRQKDGKIVTSAFEEASLSFLAQATGAEFVRLNDANSLNIQWANTLAGSKAEPHETPVYAYPLVGSLLIFFLLSLKGLLHKRDTIS